MPAKPTFKTQKSQLPPELVENIVEEACQTQGRKTISSIALTTKRFRIHANRVRFANPRLATSGVMFSDHFSVTRSIRTLARLIEDGKLFQTTLPGPECFITTLSVDMQGSKYNIMRVFDDGSLAYVFDSLFRPSPLYPPRSEFQTLTLTCGYFLREDYVGLMWSDLNPRFLASFQDLLWNSNLNRLNLGLVRGIPSNILQGSRVLCLSLGECVKVGPPALKYHAYDIDGDLELRPFSADRRIATPLEGLGFDNIPFEDIIRMVGQVDEPRLPQNIFSHLTTMNMFLDSYSDIRKLNTILINTVSLESLSLVLHLLIPANSPIADNDDWSLKLTHLRHLKVISFRKARRRFNPYPQSASACCVVVMRLLGHNCNSSSLEEIRIQFFSDFTVNQGIKIKDYLADQQISTLDRALGTQKTLPSLNRISISVDIEIPPTRKTKEPPALTVHLRDSLNLYIRSQIPRLVERHGTGVKTSVRMLPYADVAYIGHEENVRVS